MRYLSLLILFLVTFSNVALARVHVDRTISFFLPELYFELNPEQMKWVEVFSQPYNDDVRFHFAITVINDLFPDLTVLFCDENNKDLYVGRSTAYCDGVRKGRGYFEFTSNAHQSGAYYLVLDNSYSLFTSKKVFITPKVTKMLSKNEQTELEEVLQQGLKEFHETYIFDDFDLDVVSCGQENAFSQVNGGHITLCSELIFTAMLNDEKGAFAGVLMHEFGHSLLNLWHLPNWNNEKTADEFAAVMLILEDQGELIESWIDWFERNENIAAEFEIIRQGGEHPATAQRISALKDIINNKDDYVRRWLNILYPKMTKQALKKIINGERNEFHNPELATEILEKRMKLTEFP